MKCPSCCTPSDKACGRNGRYLTCRAEGGFAGASDESRASEFRAGFEARLAELETALGKNGGPFFLGCVASARTVLPPRRPRAGFMCCAIVSNIWLCLSSIGHPMPILAFAPS